MSFIYIDYLVPTIIFLIVFIYYINRYSSKYIKWVNDYWFLVPRRKLKLSNIIYFLAILGALIALLDLRGPEELIESQISDQRTIIIIDSSSSMLVEDVRPNRFQKSLLMARHFVKNAAGHNIAVVLFSDTQRRLVPFTDDIDLLDAKISGLEDIDIRYGGSNIIQAIKESIQYFKADTSDEKSEGNILVFTDSEDNGESIDIDFPDNVNIGVVGVGTLSGGKIPLRSGNKIFYGYKKHGSQEVVSKLDENFLKKMGKKAVNFKYWIARSYSIPTEEILSFFREIHREKLSKGSHRVRPVYGYKIIILFIILYILSVILKFGKNFKTEALVILISLSLFSFSSFLQAEEKEKPPKLSAKEVEMTEGFLLKMQNGELSKTNKLKLAELLLRNDELEKSLVLYNEVLKDIDSEFNVSAVINYATAKLIKNDLNEALSILTRVYYRPDISKELKQIIEDNIFIALRKKKQHKKDKNDKNDKNEKKDKQNKKDKQDKKDKQGEQDKQDKKDKQGQQDQKNNKDDQDGQSMEDKKNEQDKKNKEDMKKKNDEDKEKKEKKKDSMSLEEREKQIKKKRKMTKISPILKQILQSDRNIQKKLQETYRKKYQGSNKKDW